MSTLTVFVYGTLRPGQHNHGLLSGATHLGTVAAPSLVMHRGPGFPYATPGDGQIIGDLFTVTERQLARLDLLEGYSPNQPHALNHYVREVAPIGPRDKPATAWIYLAGPTVPLNHYPRITSGDWTTR